MGYLHQLMKQSSLSIAEPQAGPDRIADRAETAAPNPGLEVHEEVETPAAVMSKETAVAGRGETASAKSNEADQELMPLTAQTTKPKVMESVFEPLTPKAPVQAGPEMEPKRTIQDEPQAAPLQPLEQTIEREAAPGADSTAAAFFPETAAKHAQPWKAALPSQTTCASKAARSSGRKEEPPSSGAWPGEEVNTGETPFPSPQPQWQDKAALSAYVLKEVTQWVSQEEDPVPPVLNPAGPKRATARANQDQPQPFPSLREEQVQLSIGNINVVVEAPSITVPRPAPQPAGTAKPAPSFLTWQRHYLND